MVSEIRDRDGKGRGEIVRVGRQMDVHPEALRAWVRQAEIDGGTGREPRRGNRGGSPSWRGKCESCAALMRSWRRRARISRGNSTPGFRAGRFINAHRDRFGVEPACAVLEFPVSTYYAARKREREPSPREQRDEWLKKEIMRVREDRKKGRRVYGARKVWLQLQREGHRGGPVHGPPMETRRPRRVRLPGRKCRARHFGHVA